MQPLNSNHSRKRSERAGRWAENIAAWYLRARFFSILDQRYKSPGGEIDIIARRGDLIVFVEVKMRKNASRMAEALQAVNQRRIIRAAYFYLAQNPDFADKTLRFDVLFLAPFTWPTHLMGAFEET